MSKRALFIYQYKESALCVFSVNFLTFEGLCGTLILTITITIFETGTFIMSDGSCVFGVTKLSEVRLLDKAEYKIRIKELMRLSGQKKYKTAAQIADEIRWEKVKNVQMLCTVSEVYEKVGRYDESKDVLLLAYNRSPNGKTIVYRLAELSIAMGDFQEATDFYHEYMQMAPGDNNALLLKYKIYKGKGASLETLIALLEEYKTREYQEEWVLELARLYHQAGDKEKCVDICNEIDLWFNKGKSVIQALEIKKKYEPLTPLQERKLANRSEYMGKDSETQEETQPVMPAAQKNQRQASKEPPRQQSVSEILDRLRAVETNHNDPAPSVREPEPKSKQAQPAKMPEDPVAAAIVRMAREQQNSSGELERGFSILPKGKVVDSDSENFAFDLPKGVEEVDLAAVAPTHERPQSPEKKALLAEVMDDPVSPAEEKEEHTFETEEAEDFEEKPTGIFSKMFNRLKMEDDELDDDFNDDYVEDELEDKDSNGMVSRGLTGQYEKVVIEEEESEDDPLDVRLMSAKKAKKEEEYEYIYGDEDEAEEYEDIEDENERARSNKRFNFFRNTMDDDELFYDGEEGDDTEGESVQEYEPYYGEEAYEEPRSMDDVVPLSYAAKYDTLNLQKELAKSIQQLMDATEKETVDSTLENVKKMVEESHIPKLTETMKFRAIKESMLKAVQEKEAQQQEEENAGGNQGLAEDATARRTDARPKPAIELAIRLKPTDDDEIVSFDRILTRADDGQLCLIFPEKALVEEQIEGQMDLDDVIREMEKQELLSENDKENRALEEARKRALEETQGIMTEIMELLKDVIPKIGSIKDGEQKMADLAEALEKVQRSLPYTQGIMEAAETGKEAAFAIEAACAEAVEELERLESQEGQMPVAGDIQEEPVYMYETGDMQEGSAHMYGTGDMQENPAYIYETGDMQESPAYMYETGGMQGNPAHLYEAGDMQESSAHMYETGDMQEGSAYLYDEEDAPMPDLEQAFYGMEQSLQQDQEQEQQENLMDDVEYLKQQMALHQVFTEEDAEEARAQREQGLAGEAQMAAAEDIFEEELEPEVSDELMPVLEQNMKVQEEELAARQKKPVTRKEKSATRQGRSATKLEKPAIRTPEDLDEEQEEILSYFLAVKSVAPVIKNVVKQTEAAPEHMIITGEKGSGKTSIAMRIIKASQINKVDKIETIAKINATLLNQKDVTEILDKVNGGVLIIENAGSLKPSTVYAMEDALYSNKYYVQMIAVDNKKSMKKLLTCTNSFLNDIRMRIDLPIYSGNELAEFARTYAELNGYNLDGMAVLALHSVIDIFQTDQHAANLEDVKNIMDEAMERADKRTNKLLGKLFGKKKSDHIDLLESDFE